MKLWIIYKGGVVFSKVIAEMLQDHLEDYIDVSVGKVSKIEPSFLLEEELNYLIIGDITSEIITMPSVEIRDWVAKFREISEVNHLDLEVLSGFLITVDEANEDSLWFDFIQDNITTKTIYPPILYLNLNTTTLASEASVLRIVKEYSSKMIEKIIEKRLPYQR